MQYLSTFDEVKSKLAGLNIAGRTVTDVTAIGGFDEVLSWCSDDWLNIVRAIFSNDDTALDEMTFPCSFYIDEPILFKLDNEDILSIDFSGDSAVCVDTNLFSWDTESEFRQRNFHANCLLKELLGAKIADIVVETSLGNLTTADKCENQNSPEIIRSIAINFLTESHIGPSRDVFTLKFEPWLDYTVFSLMKGTDIVRFSGTRLKRMRDGYMTRENIEFYHDLLN